MDKIYLVNKMKKIIIIGGGITGLCCGIFLLKKGYSVSIYEKNDFAGGCCSGWYKDGIYIDNCMHWLTGTNQRTKTFKLWKKVGAISETSNLYQGDYFYKSIFEDKSIELSKDIEKLRQDMLSLSYIDKKEINKFINTVKSFILLNKRNDLVVNLLYKPYAYIDSYLYYRSLSLEDLANKFKHPLLKKMFTDFLPKEYSSLALIYAYATFASGNGKVYKKGSLAFANNILNYYISLGGFIHYKSEVTAINVACENIESITINNDNVIQADEYIYTASIGRLFNNLLDESYMPINLKEKLSNKLAYPIYSSFHVAFKINKNDNPFKESTIFEIEPILVGNSSVSRLMIKEYSYLYESENYVIIQAFIVQNESDYYYWMNLKKKNKDDYKNRKNNISSKILDILCANYPILKDNISIIDSWTPVTYYNYFYLHQGSYMGFTYTNKSLIKPIPYKLKNLKNFHIYTFWQKLSGGLPVSLSLGKECSKNIK